MSDASQLSRNRAAVLAISGVAAAYGIYYLYNSFSNQPTKNALHRRNAVHRQRPERPSEPSALISFKGPDDEAPLGTLVLLSRTDQNAFPDTLEYNIAPMGVPNPIHLDYFLANETNNDPEFAKAVSVAAVECLLQAVLLSSSPAQRQALDNCNLGGLYEALAERDTDSALGFQTNVRDVLAISSDEFQEGVWRFTTSAIYRDSDHRDSHTDMSHAPTEDMDGLDSPVREPSHGLKGLLYHIAEADAKRKAYEHRGIRCEECGERPIRDVRWHCLNCPDFDLCPTCEATIGHIPTHVLAKIQIPLPLLSQPPQEIGLWYPGDPRKVHPNLNAELKTKLGEKYDFDAPHMDANYDQFLCIANVPWPSDPDNIAAAIDRRAFNKALTSERWPRRFRPNALYDRMFAFYDTNNDGLIGFEEFVSGLAYLRGPQRFTPLRRAFQGFDLDGDGYINRADFIRLLKSKHEMHKLVIADAVESQEKEQTQRAMEILRSSQPISSIFNNEEIPPGEDRPRNGKVLDDTTGDLKPAAGSNAILGDDEGWAATESDRQAAFVGRAPPNAQSHEQLQHHLSRFEEMLRSPESGVLEAIGGQDYMQPDFSQMESVSTQTSGNIHRHTTFQRTGPVIDVTAETERDDPLDQDLMWQIVEDGIHEMLNPLLDAKENTDRMAILSREERAKWRDLIDEAVREKRALRDHLLSGSSSDPLMATAMESLDQANGAAHGSQNGSVFKNTLVPTDTASLEQHEAEIDQMPLEELLDSSGYSVIQESPSEGRTVANDASSNESSLDESTRLERPQEIVGDPTMPQNRPNSSRSSPSIEDGDSETSKEATDGSSGGQARSDDEPPSRERLEELATLYDVDQELKARGGPGKLSYEEIEVLVKNDSSRELKGLVTSWLEWASF